MTVEKYFTGILRAGCDVLRTVLGTPCCELLLQRFEYRQELLAHDAAIFYWTRLPKGTAIDGAHGVEKRPRSANDKAAAACVAARALWFAMSN